jgi:glycosyltransferase involved in cell wall biosynthesis
MADVSVVIPTYDRLWCLPRAIASCRNTSCCTQIVVVDDGSTDGTWEWLQRQPGLTALRQENQGQTWAINRGVAHSAGRYLRFLDSDDFLLPGTIDRQLSEAERSGADIVYSKVDLYFEQTEERRDLPELPDWDDFMAVQLGEAPGGHFLGMLFRRELVEQVPRRPDFALREDRMFLLEVALLEPRLARVPGPAGCWVQHGGQMQAGYRGMQAVVANWQNLSIFERTLSRLEQRGRLTERRRKAACRTLWPLAHLIADHSLDEACRLEQWIRSLDPGFEVPNSGMTGWLYRTIGFRRTQQLLLLRRRLLRR